VTKLGGSQTTKGVSSGTPFLFAFHSAGKMESGTRSSKLAVYDRTAINENFARLFSSAHSSYQNGLNPLLASWVDDAGYCFAIVKQKAKMYPKRQRADWPTSEKDF